MKVDSLGSIIWQKNYGSATEWEEGYSVDYDGVNIIVGGNQLNSSGTLSKIYMLKLDILGNQIWEETFGQSFNAYGKAQIGPNGNYIVSGYMRPDTASNLHSYLAKITPNQVLLWEKIYPFSAAETDGIVDVTFFPNGDIVAAGQALNIEVPSYREAFIMRTDSDGEILWKRTIKGRDTHTYVYDLEQTLDGGFVVAGYVFPDGVNTQDGWVIKLDSMGCEYDSCNITGVVEVAIESGELLIYPNPASQEFIVDGSRLSKNRQPSTINHLTIHNMLGQEVYRKSSTENHQLKINVSNWKNGIYLITLGEQRTKIVVAHD